MKKIIIATLILSLFSFMNSGCGEGFLEKTPSNAIGTPELEGNLTYVKALMDGTYKYMQKYNISGLSAHDDSGVISFLMLSDVLGMDIMTPTSWYRTQYQYSQVTRMTTSPKSRIVWQWAYYIIKNCNTVISYTTAHQDDPEWVQVEGQARILRAYCYHALVRFYQKNYRVASNAPGVPLVLEPPTGDPEADSKSRGQLSDVYTQMEKDLKWAIEHMTDDRDNKGQGNPAVAHGMLARIYLDMAYVDNTLWDDVIDHAQEACDDYPLMAVESYAQGFNDISNAEWIWGLLQDVEGSISYPGFYSFYDFVSGRFGYQNVRADSAFVALFSDEDGRKCFSERPGFNEPNHAVNDMYSVDKFVDQPDKTGDIPYMRSAEMVLMEAEALANQKKFVDAQKKLDELRAKRIKDYTPQTAADTYEDMIERIWIERRKELYGEGFAHWDILRLGFVVNGDKATRSKYHDGVGLSAPILDNDYRYIYQIPQEEFYANVKLDPVKDQNE